jgi:hypothetical protein
MEPNDNSHPDTVKSDRRETLERLGRFAMYAAPFAVLALTKKAEAASGTGPGRHL